MIRSDVRKEIESVLNARRLIYTSSNPSSRAANDAAATFLPGGNTRSVLHYDPFPLVIARGRGNEVWDLDQHRYADFVGEFSAGLYGHSDQIIAEAVKTAVTNGMVLGGPTEAEALLAGAVVERFPSVDVLRFCNSGTEANLMALVTATAITGKRKILAFREAYHGGVLVLSASGLETNVPFDFAFAEYNEVDATAGMIRALRDELGAVIVEPVLGAAGNIPGTPEFLGMLRQETGTANIPLIFDEVKTSRCGPGGIQGELNIRPDLTTLGKYLGGGLSSGAFGGRRDLMQRFDPRHPSPLRHAGTFNNNPCSMAAGYAGLTNVFTARRARQFHDDCERFRQTLNSEFAARRHPIYCIGSGSMFSIHFSWRKISNPRDIPPESRMLGRLLHMELLLSGLLIAARGDVFVMLPCLSEHLEELRSGLLGFPDEHRNLITRSLEAVA
jgi:glutamate-1-semialdehyde 2,1-aminomutase